MTIVYDSISRTMVYTTPLKRSVEWMDKAKSWLNLCKFCGLF